MGCNFKLSCHLYFLIHKSNSFSLKRNKHSFHFIQMVDLCPVVNRSGIQMVVWKPDWKKPVNGPTCPVFKWSAKSHDFTIWIPNTLTWPQIEIILKISRAVFLGKIFFELGSKFNLKFFPQKNTNCLDFDIGRIKPWYSGVWYSVGYFTWSRRMQLFSPLEDSVESKMRKKIDSIGLLERASSTQGSSSEI